MFKISCYGFLLLFLGNCCCGIYTELGSKWQTLCPAMYPKIFTSYTLVGNLTGGKYTKQTRVSDMGHCLATCCNQPSACNVAFMYNSSCYHIQCVSSKLCVPFYRPDRVHKNPPSMVLVKPVEEDEAWTDFLLDGDGDLAGSELPDGTEPELSLFGASNELSCSTTEDCAENEVCVKKSKNSNIGVCKCTLRYRRNYAGTCGTYEDLRDLDLASAPEIIKPRLLKDSRTPDKPTVKQIFIKTASKEVRLPENEVSLSAFSVPSEEQMDGHYKYAWTLLSQPEAHTGTMTDQNQMTVKLSNLSEGLYKFKVTVTGPHSYGEAYANVTVLPPKRINQAPIPIISPASQIVKLPNTGAVLDGSASKDDDKIMSYHWELQQGPIGYQPSLVDTPTLQLDNLIAGNYTFKLTVEDSDHVTNFTTANITVLKITDYPPSANAGQNVILYLPKNTLTLNGNLSTDDRGISSWEWTKSPSDENKAVDMQNTRTPYLQLSNLEEGIYTFVLKVTDDSDQSSTSEVHVFVKPPTNKPPKANAGDNITIALPETQAVLNGSKSKDDIKIVSYHWEQLEGPNKAVFAVSNASITNVTKLTKGDYLFQLTVIDDSGNKDSDTVQLKVTQNKNAPPVANAGGDFTIFMPFNALFINGSKSTDDLKIKEWQWSRDPMSLAIGNIIERTEKSPILMVSNVIPGRYIFKLKVSDDQGLSSEDSVSIIVKPDAQLYNLVELKLNIDAHLLRESQKISLIVKLEMLIREESSIVIRNLRADAHSGKVILTFFVKLKDGKSMPGPEVVSKLKEKLRQDSGLLQLSVTNVETVVCQNNCSGHGTCDQETRQCLCEVFWMQNLIQVYLRDGESNCDWSILYVIIALLSLAICWIGLIWGLICFCKRICHGKRRILRPKKKPARYSLLQPEPDESTTAFSRHKMVLSESDSDSDDVMFDKFKGRSNSHPRSMKARNGFAKSSTKVKT
ncbi:dyslexia-associated protein KIAA0319-like protein [Copidosoma floridanum]|uniref:dyslexia-associated protein KIAA0319-like protein n=1 Tax=Copidosoma floridanum TaxID=29053 RepID=UPI0006C96A35|nr:dyslexia-associated protein KIAA0319-like protein [Copidosoma floridanum]XP_014214908.1 dyslexia-associated protein KIAA0319-like protein [Copidosoma floridanum]